MDKRFELTEQQRRILAEIKAKIDEFYETGGLLVYWTEDSTVWAANMSNAEDYVVMDDYDFRHEDGFDGFINVVQSLECQPLDIEYQGSEYGVYAKVKNVKKNLF